MGAIGEWVIDEACRAIASWPEPITGQHISLKQIVASLPNMVSQALSRYRVPGNRLELEVTEGVFLGAENATLDTLKRLRALGVGIASTISAPAILRSATSTRRSSISLRSTAASFAKRHAS